MIITVAAVRVVQVAFHKVIRMIAMRNRLMPTGGAVCVALVVSVASVRWRACFRVRGTHSKSALINVIAVGAMHVAIVQIIAVISMLDRRVTAA